MTTTILLSYGTSFVFSFVMEQIFTFGDRWNVLFNSENIWWVLLITRMRKHLSFITNTLLSRLKVPKYKFLIGESMLCCGNVVYTARFDIEIFQLAILNFDANEIIWKCWKCNKFIQNFVFEAALIKNNQNFLVAGFHAFLHRSATV